MLFNGIKSAFTQHYLDAMNSIGGNPLSLLRDKSSPARIESAIRSLTEAHKLSLVMHADSSELIASLISDIGQSDAGGAPDNKKTNIVIGQPPKDSAPDATDKGSLISGIEQNDAGEVPESRQTDAAISEPLDSTNEALANHIATEPPVLKIKK